MEQTDESGESMANEIPSIQSLVPHVQRAARLRGNGANWVGLVAYGTMAVGIWGIACAEKGDFAKVMATGIAASIFALLRSGQYEQSNDVLEQALFDDPEGTLEAFDIAWDAARCELRERDIEDLRGRIIRNVMRRVRAELRSLDSLPVRPETIREAMAANAAEIEDAKFAEDIRDEGPQEYGDDDGIIFTIVPPPDMRWRLDLEYDIGMSIKNESSLEMRCQYIRPRIVEAFAANERLMPQVMEMYGGRTELRPLADEYYRHQTALLFLYDECMRWEDEADLHAMHRRIEEEFALETHGHAEILPSVRDRMAAERSMAGQRAAGHRPPHAWRGLSKEEKRLQKEFERHVRVLGEHCAKVDAGMHIVVTEQEQLALSLPEYEAYTPS